jgi:ATP-dependent Clp protease ATP-binding subunit ClpX
MEGTELEFTDDAMKAIANKAMNRKTGARGLRTIMESILLDIMYDLPSMDDVTKVVINGDVVAGESEPYLVLENDEPVAASK